MSGILIRGDARMLPIRDRSVQCVVTSPPYWGLRRYRQGQLGLEATPEAYVASIVGVMREVWRVLATDGTLWLNLGDAYAGGGRGGNPDVEASPIPAGLKAKDLVGMPWRVAFALQAEGWYLRADIIWAKSNPMPESCRDRPTKAHEYLFLLTKAERYFYNAAAIAQPVAYVENRARVQFSSRRALANNKQPSGNEAGQAYLRLERRNVRSVWTITSEPYAGAHFATFPEALIEPCILAGSRIGDAVLDPFCGTGTVGAVAERYGRSWVGIDLAYQELARDRTAQRGFVFTMEDRHADRSRTDLCDLVV